MGGCDGRIHAVEAVTARYGGRCEEALGGERVARAAGSGGASKKIWGGETIFFNHLNNRLKINLYLYWVGKYIYGRMLLFFTHFLSSFQFLAPPVHSPTCACRSPRLVCARRPAVRAVHSGR